MPESETHSKGQPSTGDSIFELCRGQCPAGAREGKRCSAECGAPVGDGVTPQRRTAVLEMTGPRAMAILPPFVRSRFSEAFPRAGWSPVLS